MIITNSIFEVLQPFSELIVVAVKGQDLLLRGVQVVQQLSVVAVLMTSVGVRLGIGVIS